MLHLLQVVAASQCGLAKPLSTESIGAIVRGKTYTEKLQSGCTSPHARCTHDAGLDPQCASGTNGCIEEPCFAGTKASELQVRFNSRSYMLSDGTAVSGSCDGHSFGDDDYSCVDYSKGSYRLAGQVLKFDVELDYADCGCNAAVYLVAMAQNPDPTVCKDYYCDANSVCGVACVEIDLMEANRNAFVATVHVADDSSGESFGIGHYVNRERRFVPSDDKACAYGPRDFCTINTHHRFTASYAFAAEGQPFGITVTLEQEGRRLTLDTPVRYASNPSQGAVPSAEAANAILASSVSAGLTLVTSYWAGPKRSDMGWLDEPCSAAEVQEWQCSDYWSEQQPGWPFVCNSRGGDAPECLGYWTLANLSVGTPSLLSLPATVAILAAVAILGVVAWQKFAGSKKRTPARLARHGGVEMEVADFDEEDFGSEVGLTSSTAPPPKRKSSSRVAAEAVHTGWAGGTKPKTKAAAKASAGQGSKVTASKAETKALAPSRAPSTGGAKTPKFGGKPRL